MLDEEVVIKKARHTSESFLVYNALGMLLVSLLFMGGNTFFGTGILITTGLILPSMNVFIYKRVWADAPAHVVRNFFLALSPLLICLVIAVAALSNGILEPVEIGQQLYYALHAEDRGVPASAAHDALAALSSELLLIGVAATGLSIYFITDSRFVIRKILAIGAIIAAVFAFLGFVHDALIYSSKSFRADIFGANAFATIPDKFHFAALALIWLGAVMAIGMYTAQHFSSGKFLSSYKFVSLVCAALLFYAVLYCGTPLQRALGCLICSAGFLFWAWDARPTMDNLMRHVQTPFWKTRKNRLTRGAAPALVYAVFALCSVAMLADTLSKSAANPAERLIVDSADKSSMQMDERKALYENSIKLADKNKLFGWGTASFPTVFAFSQDSDFGDSPWLSPKSDLLQRVIENGFVGLALLALTPVALFVFWLARLRFSLCGLLMLLAILSTLACAAVDYPMQSPAVAVSFWILLASFLRWDCAEIK